MMQPPRLVALLWLLLPGWATAWIPGLVGTSAAVSSSNKPPIVICPGFGNDQIDYLSPMNLGEEASFAQALRRRGFPVFVVPVQRTNWLRFASGIVTPAFWSQTMTPQNPSFGWYLDKVVSTVEEAVATHDGEKALLIGHSAGGWLARAALGNGTWTGAAASQANELVRGCVTLGSPHLPPQPPGVDVTRGALQHVHVQYPGAFLRDQGIQYVTVAGVAVQGDGTAERRSLSNFAYRSYIQVCGRGDVVGDGVVPLGSAHLDGAKQVNLKNVFHSINAPDQWYGSEGVIDSWLRQVEGLKY